MDKGEHPSFNQFPTQYITIYINVQYFFIKLFKF